MDLSAFEGRWRLVRRIEDSRAGDVVHLDGSAVFEPDGRGLRYHETGTLHLPGRPALQAERTYLWRALGPEVVVLFADGRSFHSFAFAGGAASHLCGADLYRVDYAFGDWPNWTATWDVTGPRKDYRSVSAYTPE